MPSFKPQPKTIFFFILCWIVFAFLQLKFRPIAWSEPDLFFQIAIAKESAKYGLVHSLPQPEDLQWADHYPDKNFIYTLISGVAYKSFGEMGVFYLPWAIGTLLLGLLFFVAGNSVPLALLTLSLMTFLLTPDVANKLALVRPHTLAMLIFQALILSLHFKKRKLAFLCTILFCWSYHAIYLPLLAIAIFSFFSNDRKLVWTSFLGVLLGTVLHPYFPTNLGWLWLNAKIALFPNNTVGLVPLELYKLSAFSFVFRYAGYVALLGILLVLKQTRAKLTAIGWMCVALWILTWLSPRAVEYAAPSTLLLFLLAAKELPQKKAWAIACLFVALQSYSMVQFYQRSINVIGSPQANLSAADTLPSDGNQKVFNCEWTTGPYLLYKRPNLRFVDLWGPYVLAERSAQTQSQKFLIASGQSENPGEEIQKLFKSDFVFCQNPGLVQRMEKDPEHFTRLFPKNGNIQSYFAPGFPFVYAIKQKS